MTSFALADLKKVLTPHVPLGKSRVETLCLLVLGMISARTPIFGSKLAVKKRLRAGVV